MYNPFPSKLTHCVDSVICNYCPHTKLINKFKEKVNVYAILLKGLPCLI
jgi:methionine aminopeptidase